MRYKSHDGDEITSTSFLLNLSFDTCNPTPSDLATKATSILHSEEATGGHRISGVNHSMGCQLRLKIWFLLTWHDYGFQGYLLATSMKSQGRIMNSGLLKVLRWWS